MNEKIKRILIRGSIAATVVVTLFFLLAPTRVKEVVYRIDTELPAIVMATYAYMNEFGTQPVGTAEEIMRALHGENKRGIVFLEKNRADAPPMKDPWDTPYSISTADDRIVAASAGPDRMWNTDDDKMWIKIIEHVH